MDTRGITQIMVLSLMVNMMRPLMFQKELTDGQKKQVPQVILVDLEASMGEEMHAGNMYRHRAERARAHGYNSIAYQYEDIAREEDQHFRRLRRYLEGLEK